MHPVVKEDFYKTLLPEGVDDTSYNKLSNLFTKTNESLFASDVDYNIQVGLLIGLVSAISVFTSWYINAFWPMGFLFLVLVSVFISSMHLRTRRDQLIQEKSALKKTEDKNLVVIEDNFDTLLSKYQWIAFTFCVTITACALCGLALSNSLTVLLGLSGFVLSLALTYLLYYNNISRLSSLRRKFQDSYNQIIVA
jgi:hypothetical protein